MKKANRLKITSLLLFVIIVAGFMLPGCFGIFGVKATGIAFDTPSISLIIGDKYRPSVSVLPDLADDKSYTLRSDDELKVKIVENVYILAVGAGETSITAISNDGKFEAKASVLVGYKAHTSIAVTTEGQLFQEPTAMSEVTFHAVFDSESDPNSEIIWKVNDTVQLDTDAIFTYLPTAKGKYTITATISGSEISTTSTIMVAERLQDLALSYTGVLLQESGNYSSVTITTSFTNPEGNPEPDITWYQNDIEMADKKNMTSITFKPSIAGITQFSAVVNGVKATLAGGATFVEVVAKGSLTAPRNVRFDFDSDYPNLWISWDKQEGVQNYTIKINDTLVSTANFPDRLNSDKTAFNLTGNIDIFKRADISVMAQGWGDAFVDSDYSVEIIHIAVPTIAREYLNFGKYQGMYLGNTYLDMQSELDDIMQYLIFNKAHSVDVFVAYELPGDIKQAYDLSYNRVAIAGNYDMYMPYNRGGGVYTIKIEHKSDSSPTKIIGVSGDNKDIGLRAIKPHINTDTTKYRPSSYKFAIDFVSKTANVATSDQLYYAVMRGYKPVPTVGSKADTAYKQAKEIMRKICTDEMTEIEKAHAIYDWIMWRVIYDQEVIKIKNLDESVKYEAFYLEGVFNSVYPYAVCDGMAKAFTLMCGIEGISAIRVPGMVIGGGGHAWNKVKLDGDWYIVDPTWGDVNYSNGATGENYELATHAYFMKRDSDVEVKGHKEDNADILPRATTLYNYYDQDITYDGATFDFYIDKPNTLEREINAICDYIVARYNAEYINAINSGDRQFGVDFKLSTLFKLYPESSLTDEIDNIIGVAMRKHHANYKLASLNNNVYTVWTY